MARACISASPAFALDLSGSGQPAGSSFAASESKDIDPVKPWHACSDPSCESIEVPKMSFSSTAFGVREKYDVSQFHGYGHPANWKPESMGEYCTPVPEPQTYAMLIMGLGALTFVARRRKLALK